MMDGIRAWLLTLIAASVLCALADSLMPAGGVKRVGKLVCGLVLLCAILSPVVSLDVEGGQDWLEGWFQELDGQKSELEQRVNEGMKTIIEQEYAAYILDKAAEMGLTCTARVSCRAEEGLYVPDQAEVAGSFSEVEQSRLTQVIQEDLGIPPERQSYVYEEELP